MGCPKGKCAQTRKTKAKKQNKTIFWKEIYHWRLKSSNKRDRLDTSRRLVKGRSKSGLEESEIQTALRKQRAQQTRDLKSPINKILFYVFVLTKSVWQFLAVSSNTLKWTFKSICMEERNKASLKSRESGNFTTIVYICMWYLVWRRNLVPETCTSILQFHSLVSQKSGIRSPSQEVKGGRLGALVKNGVAY